MKTRLLVITDWVGGGSGFSEEMRHVLYRLAQSGEYEIYWIGLGYQGMSLDIPDTCWPDLPQKGATIRTVSGFGGSREGYGIDSFERNFEKINPDFVMGMGDPHCFFPYVYNRAVKNVRYPYIAYVTLDGLPVHPSFKQHLSGINIPLAMTEWAMLEYQKAGIPMSGYVHHGVNWKWFTVSDTRKQKIRKKYGIGKDTVVFMDPNFNQFRKRQYALLQAWKEFHPERKDTILFLNTVEDTSDYLGWDLRAAIEQIGVPKGRVVFPKDIHGHPKYWEQPYDMEFHRDILAIADVIVSCTGGEGFGKLFLEALSMRIPVIAPKVSAIPEVCEEGAILVPLYDGPAGTFRLSDKQKHVDLGVVNQEKFVEALQYMYDHPEERKELGLIGRGWARNFDYDTQVVPGWMNILERYNPDVILTQEILREVM